MLGPLGVLMRELPRFPLSSRSGFPLPAPTDIHFACVSAKDGAMITGSQDMASTGVIAAQNTLRLGQRSQPIDHSLRVDRLLQLTGAAGRPPVVCTPLQTAGKITSLPAEPSEQMGPIGPTKCAAPAWRSKVEFALAAVSELHLAPPLSLRPAPAPVFRSD